MQASLTRVNRKPIKTTQQHSTAHGEIQALTEVQQPRHACPDFIARCSWDGALRYAVQRSNHDDYEVADAMHVSHGQMSKVMRGSAGFFGPRLVSFMRITCCLAPLQWLADQMGCDVVQRAGQSAYIRELEEKLAQAKTQRRLS